MPIRILVADDSACMLSAVRQVLQNESRIRIVGETSAFPTIMQMIVDYNPEVLLFDLHMAERRSIEPAFVKSHLGSVSHALAMSFGNDWASKALAASYDVVLLDKMNLYAEMIPAIMHCRCNEL